MDPLPEERPVGRRPLPWEAVAVMGLSLLLTVLAVWLLHQQTERLADARFRALARDVAGAVLMRMDGYEQILRGGAAFMEASGGTVSRSAWRTYVDGLRIGETYPGIQGVGFAQRVGLAELTRHEASVRAEGFPDYRVQPDDPADVYFPIVYLEPFAGRNLRAFGYDMFSEPVRHAAMARARDTGDTAASGKVRLVQETSEDVQNGFLLYVPVYDPARPRDGVEARHRALLGFIYSAFRMHDLMAPLLTGVLREHLDIRIHDGADTSPDSLLFGGAPADDAVRRMVTTVGMFGRWWTLDIRSSPAFEESLDRRAPLAVLLAGLVITALLVTVTRSLASEREKATALRRSYDALARARAEAEHANAAKTRFLAAASHDLRQPMQTLGIYLHLISEQVPAGALRRLVDGARDGYDAAQRMLNAIMDIAALETGVAQPRMEALDLDAFLDRIGRELCIEAQEKGLELRVRLCAVHVASDPAMLERIVRNLLHNALKYTRSGVILLSCRAAHGHAVIKVQDTGPGIPPDRMHLIFEDFYQVGNPERDRSKGLGLGLATVARLTRLLGYRVGVRSRLGRGTVFTVEIPLASGGAADVRDDPPALRIA